eukprot:s1993_g12.t1
MTLDDSEIRDFDAQIEPLEAEIAKRMGPTKPRSRLRFRHVPSCLCRALRSLKELRQDLLGRFVTVSGLVASMSSAKVVEVERNLLCACGARYTVQTPPIDANGSQAPGFCEGCGGAPVNFKDLGGGTMTDYQEIRLQDIAGLHCSHAIVVLTGELVSSAVPGDLVVVGGMLRARWPTAWCPRESKRLTMQLVLDARDLRPLHEAPPRSLLHLPPAEDCWRQRRQMVMSVAPHLHGLEVPKLAVLLALLASSEKDETRSDARVPMRQHPHLLLLGDPGTGKTQLLQCAMRRVRIAVLGIGAGVVAGFAPGFVSLGNGKCGWGTQDSIVHLIL